MALRRLILVWNRWAQRFKQLVGVMANMVPYRRRTNLDTERECTHIDAPDIFIGGVKNGSNFRSRNPVYLCSNSACSIEARNYIKKGGLFLPGSNLANCVKKSTPPHKWSLLYEILI